METNMAREISDNVSLLVILRESGYAQKIREIAVAAREAGTGICYVCLSKPYADVVTELRKNRIDTDTLFFIDVLSSHYERPRNTEKCIFIESPSEMSSIKDAIARVLEKEKCGVILFDTISALLTYHGVHSILGFTNSLVSESIYGATKKLFIMLDENGVQENDFRTLEKDLEMFADRKVDMTGDG